MMIAVAAVCAIAVGVGGFFAIRGASDADADAVRYVTENDGEAFSYSRATTTVDAATAMRFTMTMRAPGATGDLSAEIDRTSERLSMTMDATTDDDMFGLDDLSMAVIGDAPSGTTYLSGDFITAWLGIETEWLAQTDGVAALDVDIDDLVGQPVDVTATFAGAEPVEVGIETIDGVEMKHFVVEMTSAELLAADPEALEGLGTADVEAIESIDFDVWVDEQSRLRRVVMSADALGESIEVEMRIEHLDEPIDIALPDPGDVTDYETAVANSPWSELTPDD